MREKKESEGGKGGRSRGEGRKRGNNRGRTWDSYEAEMFSKGHQRQQSKGEKVYHALG